MWRYFWASFCYAWGGLYRSFGNWGVWPRGHALAVRWFSRALRLQPGLPDVLLDRGILLWRELGQAERALVDFDALLAAQPAHPAARLNRALAFQELGRYRPALDDLDAYIAAAAPDDEYLDIAIRTAAHLRALLDEAEAAS